MRVAEHGFSLIEVLVAAALFAVAAIGAFELVRQLAASTRALTARHLAYATLDRLAGQLRAEARSASAIWIGARGGSGRDDCVQLDFFAADAAGPVFWSYRTFANHQASDPVPPDALQRLASRAPIPSCDPRSAGTLALSGLRAPLAVTAIPPAGLHAHADADAGSPDTPFVAAGVPATPPIDVGVLDADGAPVRGGNTIVEARIETGEGSRTVDLLAGVFPSGFTEVLRYTCTERCDVARDTAGAKTITACAMSWQSGWSEFVTWNDAAANPDGSLRFPGGWFIGGTFTFTYSGTRQDGGIDTVVRPYPASNWDAARDYTAFPPDRAARDGTSAGSFAPWDVRAEPATQWLGDFGPYLASGTRAPIDTERARCDAVQAQGAASGFYANG